MCGLVLIAATTTIRMFQKSSLVVIVGTGASVLALVSHMLGYTHLYTAALFCSSLPLILLDQSPTEYNVIQSTDNVEYL